MLVIHSDADSFHLLSDAYTVALTAIQDRSPRMTVCQRKDGTVTEVWTGTLQQGRTIDARHNHAAIVRAVLSGYVDSGVADNYRHAHGTTGKHLQGRGA